MNYPSAFVRDEHAERFWSKVMNVGRDGVCWAWSGGRGRGGYGQFKIVTVAGNLNFRASRVAWILTHGEIPDDVCVLHRCDNPPCCNPAHLFLGSHRDNAADRSSKGRDARGDRNGSRKYPLRRPRGECHVEAKLTDHMVLGIRKSVESAATLARRIGVSKATVLRVRNRQAWTHVAEPGR